jgi:hypothetical protein
MLLLPWNLTLELPPYLSSSLEDGITLEPLLQLVVAFNSFQHSKHTVQTTSLKSSFLGSHVALPLINWNYSQGTQFL